MPAAKRNDHLLGVIDLSQPYTLPVGHPATVIETQYGTVTIETDKRLTGNTAIFSHARSSRRR